MSRPRLVDVAARAGVSRTTASAALSGSGRIGEDTRRRVLAVAAEMGYEINRLAANLRNQRAGAIGVYLPPESIGYEYYLEFAFGVVDEAMHRETPVVLIPNGTTEASLARDHVDGYIVIDAIDDDPQLRRILQTGKPVVAAEPLPDGLPPAAGLVAFDHTAGTTELLDHLAEQGARRIAMINPPLDTAWAREVTDTYLQWCRAHEVRPSVVTAPFLADAASIAEPLDELFGPEPPDAVVVAQDGIASAVAAAITARGHTIGGDVLLAACVDGLSVRSSVPPITALDLVPRDHGKACADLLLSLLPDTASSDPVGAVPTMLSPVLRVRASTTAH